MLTWLPCAAQIGALLACSEKAVGRLLTKGRQQLRALPKVDDMLYAYL
jgi:DNA-directed RNA polymerase specialized sigma24 family protein